MDLGSSDREILEHYVGFLGREPVSVSTLDLPHRRAPYPVYTLEFSPSGEGEPWIYATVGASRKAQGRRVLFFRSHGHRVELILTSNVRNEELASSLGAISIYPFVHNTFFAPGHTVAGQPGAGVAPGSPLTDIFFWLPVFMPPEFELVRHSDGEETHVLWTIPVHGPERVHARDNGPQALLDAFSGKDVDTSDLHRPSSV